MGVPAKNLKFMVLGFESDRFITVKTPATNPKEPTPLTIIDVQNGFSMETKKNPA
jgi:hypothetical protein